MKIYKKKTSAVICLLGLVVCAISVYAIFTVQPYYIRLGQDGYWTEVHAVDINSGRIRRTVYVFKLKAQEHVEDTLLTDALRNSAVIGRTSEWVCVYIFPIGIRISPSTTYHSAIMRIRNIEREWTTNNVARNTRTAQAEEVIRYWHSNKLDF